ILAGLFLERRHPVEPADARDTIKDPGELGMLRNLALVEDDVLLWIDTAGQERGRNLARRARQFVRVLPHSDGVKIDDTINTVIAILQRHELGNGTKIVAEMQIAGRLHAGKNAFLERHSPPSLPCAGAMPRRRRAAQGPYDFRCRAVSSLNVTTPSNRSAAK